MRLPRERSNATVTQPLQRPGHRVVKDRCKPHSSNQRRRLRSSNHALPPTLTQPSRQRHALRHSPSTKLYHKILPEIWNIVYKNLLGGSRDIHVCCKEVKIKINKLTKHRTWDFILRSCTFYQPNEESRHWPNRTHEKCLGELGEGTEAFPLSSIMLIGKIFQDTIWTFLGSSARFIFSDATATEHFIQENEQYLSGLRKLCLAPEGRGPDEHPEYYCDPEDGSFNED